MASRSAWTARACPRESGGPLHGQHLCRAAMAQPQIRGGLPPCLCECGRSQDRYWRLAGLLQHGASAPEPRLSHTAANLPGRPVDMWTIGGADRLRFPRFPSELGKRGNARLHIPTGATINKAIDNDASKSRGVVPATAPTMIGADIETGGATP